MEPILQDLIQLLGKEKVLTGDDLKTRYTHIWKMDQGLSAKAVLLPNTTNDVSKIMGLCDQYQQGVLVHGGLTNLVGSTETRGDEIVISTERLNKIEEIDESSRTMTVQAGVILENILNAAREKDLLFPQSFGAKGSAQIGGVIATNAGGLRVFKYGMTRNLALGLEVVLADGRIINSMKKIIKDNSAYDLKQMFIGSEGTLGIITRAVLRLVEAPKSRNSAFVALNNYDSVLQLLKYMDAGSAGNLSSFELIWGKAYERMTDPTNQVKAPLPHGYTFYILLETLGADQKEDHQVLENLLATALEKEMIEDAVLTHSQSDLDWFWRIREDVNVLRLKNRYDQHFDVSIPLATIGRYADEVSHQLKQINGVEEVFIFGHVADGNIHLIVNKSNENVEVKNKINEIVYGPIKSYGGSVSAEHGIGLDKKAYLPLCRTAEEIQLMKQLKKALDPKGLLNPGKIFDVKKVIG